MRLACLILALCFSTLGTPLLAEGPPPSRVVLLGDSTVITSYLPAPQRHAAVLQKKLDEQYGAGAAEVINWADNGDFIGRFLLNGTYEKERQATPGADVFLIRYGINDEKRYSPQEFGGQLRKLIDLLHADYPKAHFILQSGVYADPEHFTADRNRFLNPYWEQARQVAQERGLPFCDVNLAMKEATAAGNWDLRIRRSGERGVYVLDASQDAAHVADGKSWFTNIHPNAEGVRVSVLAEARTLGEVFPQKLPTGGPATARAPRPGSDYEALLGITRDTLEIRSRRPRALRDDLQTATQK